MHALMRTVAPRLLSRAGTPFWQHSIRHLSGEVDPAPDSHDDFKPKVKAQPGDDVAGAITQDISQNKVFLYMKGVPQAPQCGFSMLVCQILEHYGVEYGSRNVLADPEIREGIKKFTNWPTIPQVFINGEFVGGSDILRQMHESGELQKLFAKKE